MSEYYKPAPATQKEAIKNAPVETKEKKSLDGVPIDMPHPRVSNKAAEVVKENGKKDLTAIARTAIGTDEFLKIFKEYYKEGVNFDNKMGRYGCALVVATLLKRAGYDIAKPTGKNRLLSVEGVKNYLISTLKFHPGPLQKNAIVIWEPIRENGNFHMGIVSDVSKRLAIDNRGEGEGVGKFIPGPIERPLDRYKLDGKTPRKMTFLVPPAEIVEAGQIANS